MPEKRVPALVPLDSSPPLFFSGRLKVQRHILSWWYANVEIKECLFVAFGVLLSPQYQQKWRKLRKDNLRPVDLRMTPPHRERSSDAAQTCLAHDDALRDRDHRTPCRRIHRALRPALASHRNTRHPAVSGCSRSRRGPGRGSSHSRRDSRLRPGPHSSKPYSFVFSLESFSRMNASISGALARMRSHCSL